MPNKTSTVLPDNNRQWILGGGAAILTVVLTLGGIISDSLQTQIDKNQERIYQINSEAVTEDKLDRQIKQVTDYIDIRVQSLESQQRETVRQLTILVNDTKDFRSEVRDAINSDRAGSL